MHLKILSVISAMSVTILSACGSGSEPNTAAPITTVGQTASISLTETDTRTIKTGIGPANLLDVCSAPWPSWSGEATGIRCPTPDEVRESGGGLYNPQGLLIIPAPQDGKQMTVGVRRYDTPLREGFTYTLRAYSQGSAAAVLFLFNTQGELIPLNDDGLTIVSNDTLSFSAPADVAGYYLQVQSGWQATEDDTIAPYMPTPVSGGGLIDLGGKPWTDWSGESVRVGYNRLTAELIVREPESGQSLTYGVQRYQQPLVEGQQYELTIGSRSAPIWLLLFMFDANGQLITREGRSWELVIGQAGTAQSTVFTAPAGVASFAVQVQGEYNATERAFGIPTFDVFDDS